MDEIIKERMLRTLKENLSCEWGTDGEFDNIEDLLREMYLESDSDDRSWYDSEEHHLHHIQNKFYQFLSAIRDEFEKFIEIYVIPSCDGDTISVILLDDKLMYREHREQWRFYFKSEEELVDEMYRIYREIRSKYPPKWRQFVCWNLDEEEIYHAAFPDVANPDKDSANTQLTEEEIQIVVDNFKDAISLAFEEWEEALSDIVEENKIGGYGKNCYQPGCPRRKQAICTKFEVGICAPDTGMQLCEPGKEIPEGD